MRVPPWVCAFPRGIPQLQSDWSLSCDYGLDYASYCENNSNNNDNNNNNNNNKNNNNMINIVVWWGIPPHASVKRGD